MTTKEPSKLVRFTLYIGYGDKGRERLDTLRAEAVKRNTSVYGLILTALKQTFGI